VGAKRDFLQRRVVPNIANVPEMTLVTQLVPSMLVFKAIIFHHPVGIPILPGQISKTSNSTRTAMSTVMKCGKAKSSLKRVCQKVDAFPSIALFAPLSP